MMARELAKVIQTRSDENGINYYDTIAQAFEAAAKDSTIWKISFPDSDTDERVRLIRIEGNAWKYEPIVIEAHKKESREEFAQRIFGAFLHGKEIICHCGQKMVEKEALLFECSECGSTMKLHSKTKPN